MLALFHDLQRGGGGFTPSDPRYVLVGVVILFLLTLCLIASGAVPGLFDTPPTATPVP